MPIKAPDQVFEELFIDLHASKLWPDGKTISDALPLASPEVILVAYQDKRKAHDFDLKAFFNHYFKPNSSPSKAFKSDTRRSVKEHIELLWEILTREKDEHILGVLFTSTLSLHRTWRTIQRNLLLGQLFYTIGFTAKWAGRYDRKYDQEFCAFNRNCRVYTQW